MSNNELCYSFNVYDKTICVTRLEIDHMNGGFLPKPPGASYIDPSSIKLKDNETLILVDGNQEAERWEKIPYYIDKKLYHKSNKSEMTITKIGESPDDYPEYTEIQLPNGASLNYYNFSESANSWIFDIEKYKSDALSRITSMCIEENYRMLPQHKRDNVYAGSPASDNYPPYLQGAAGRGTIAKLNAIYQAISERAKSAIQAATSQEEIDNIIAGIKFPSETEILAEISVS